MLKTIWGALRETGTIIKMMWNDGSSGSSSSSEDDDWLRPDDSSSAHATPSNPHGNISPAAHLPPAEHNLWGAAPDYSQPTSDDSFGSCNDSFGSSFDDPTRFD